MSGETTLPDPDPAQTKRPARAHGELPPLSDPGKDERAAEGVPVVPAFDGYRAFAILTVVVFHVFINSGALESAGDSFGGQLIWAIGPQFVDVLFIVSGFVVFLPTVAQRGSFGSVPGYAIRRGARLLPAYWLSLGVMLLVMGTQAGVGMPGLADYASNFSGQQTFVQLLSPGTPIGFGFDTPLWTLTLEIGFYIVLPFVAASYFKRPLVGLAIALATAVLWREAFAHIGEIAGWFGLDIGIGRAVELQLNSLNQLPNWAFSFAAGMTGAWAYVWISQRYERETVERAAIRVLIPAALVFALFVYLVGRKAIGATFPNLEARESSFLSIGYTASLATVMVALALAPRRLQTPFAHPLTRKLGDISYGVYLIQAPILWFLIFHTGLRTDGSVGALASWLAAVLPASILYGYLSARLVEQPIRRWARRFGRRAQASPEGGEASPRGSPEPAAPRG
jgi:peptidoglycan/LPS O-acetylase OafA/YrhL